MSRSHTGARISPRLLVFLLASYLLVVIAQPSYADKASAKITERANEDSAQAEGSSISNGSTWKPELAPKRLQKRQQSVYYGDSDDVNYNRRTYDSSRRRGYNSQGVVTRNSGYDGYDGANYDDRSYDGGNNADRRRVSSYGSGYRTGYRNSGRGRTAVDGTPITSNVPRTVPRRVDPVLRNRDDAGYYDRRDYRGRDRDSSWNNRNWDDGGNYQNLGLYAYGRPGQDFTLYDSVPETGFSCKDKQWLGYYADTASSCQAFYFCQQDGRQDSFLCPNATLFNQQTLTCDYWYNVDCAATPSYYGVNADLYTYVPTTNTVAAGRRYAGDYDRRRTRAFVGAQPANNVEVVANQLPQGTRRTNVQPRSWNGVTRRPVTNVPATRTLVDGGVSRSRVNRNFVNQGNPGVRTRGSFSSSSVLGQAFDDDGYFAPQPAFVPEDQFEETRTVRANAAVARAQTKTRLANLEVELRREDSMKK